MTSPQSDPATDVGAALARLAEQTIGLQRQLTRMEAVNAERDHFFEAKLRDYEERITALTDAKFATFRALIEGHSDRVALALDSTEKAIGKAETATAKAIDKESEANNTRFDTTFQHFAQLTETLNKAMPRTEATQLAEQATQRIRELTDLASTLATRTEMQATTDRYAERIGELNDRLTRVESIAQGAAGSRAGLYAALGVATAVIVAIVIVINLVTAHTP